MKQIKRLYRKAQKIKYSSSKNEAKKAIRYEVVQQAYQHYRIHCTNLLEKSQQTLKEIVNLGNLLKVEQIHHYSQHAERQIDQINWRVLKGERIPHSEKVFSIFEEHTEWVKKGKAGVPVELGMRVCVLEDQYHFILHHRVMWQETDDQVATAMINDALQRFPTIKQCSFDKGLLLKK